VATGLGYLTVGEFGRAIQIMHGTIAALAGTQRMGEFGADARLAVVAKSYLVRALADTGGHDEAHEIASEAVADADTLRSPFSAVFARVAAGYLRLRAEDPAGAIPELREASERCISGQTGLMVPACQALLGFALAKCGELDEGLSLLVRGVKHVGEIGFLWQQPLRIALLAHTHAMRGERADAVATASAAIELAEKQDERGSLAYAYEIRAIVVVFTVAVK
jgi:hypothetical protein